VLPARGDSSAAADWSAADASPEPPAIPASPPANDSQPPGPPGRVAALIEVVLCSGFPTQIVIIALLTAVGLRSVEPDGRLSMPFVVALSLIDAGLLITLIFGFLILHRERPREVFLGRRPVGAEVRLGLISIPGVFLFVLIMLAIILRVLPWLHNVPENPLEALIETPRDVAFFSVVAIVAGGFREELQRAFLLWRFEQYLGGPAIGLGVTSVLFGAGHVMQGYDAAVVTGMLGALWGAMYLWRRSSVAPIVSHAGFNMAEIVRYAMFR
jgi:uncharacterized protein